MAPVLLLTSLLVISICGWWLRGRDAGVGIRLGMLAGFFVAGIGSRLVMRAIAFVDPLTSVEFTLGGTLFVVMLVGAVGALLGGLAGWLYVGIRGWLPGQSAGRGLVYGGLILLTMGGWFFSADQFEGFSDFQPPLLGVALFAVLPLTYGWILGLTYKRRRGDQSESRPAARARWVGFLVLALVATLGALFTISAIARAIGVDG